MKRLRTTSVKPIDFAAADVAGRAATQVPGEPVAVPVAGLPCRGKPQIDHVLGTQAGWISSESSTNSSPLGRKYLFFCFFPVGKFR